MPSLTGAPSITQQRVAPGCVLSSIRALKPYDQYGGPPELTHSPAGMGKPTVWFSFHAFHHILDLAHKLRGKN